MAQTKKPETEAPESDTAQATGIVQNPDATGGNNTAPARPPAATPGETADIQAATGEPSKTEGKSKARANGDASNGNGKNRDDDYEPARRDRQIAQGRHPDDDPGYGRQARRDEQRNLFGEPDDTYYDRRPHAGDRDRDYDGGRRASQGYGHTAARGDDERLSREYGSDYRRYSDAGYDDRRRYESRERAFDQSPYGDRVYSEGGQYRPRPQQYRPNDNGRDFEREAREQPRNRWRESNVDPRYDDAYDNHRNQETGNRAWSSQGNQDRHRDWDRGDHGRYSNARHQDQDRGHDQSDRFGTRGYGNQDERGRHEQRHRGEPVAGNRSNDPAAREDDRGDPGRWRDERRDYRESQTDDRYEYDNGHRRRR